MVTDVHYTPIGTIHSPFTAEEGTPIQGGFSTAEGTVEIDPRYEAGLADLEGFSHVILCYHFHLVEGFDLRTEPYLDEQPHGVFATRSPRRPNPIGHSVVELTGVTGGTLAVEGIDVIDGTPLLDLKPFVPAFDGVENVRIGWLADALDETDRRRADDRFLD